MCYYLTTALKFSSFVFRPSEGEIVRFSTVVWSLVYRGYSGSNVLAKSVEEDCEKLVMRLANRYRVQNPPQTQLSPNFVHQMFWGH
jgi:hypothetical protein